MEQIALSAPSSTPAMGNPKDVGPGIGENHVDYKPLFEHFGIKDVDNPRHNEALGRIWEYAKNTSQGKDRDSIIFEVIRLNNRLGNTSVGQKPYAKMEMYAREWLKMRQADARIKELEANDR